MYMKDIPTCNITVNGQTFYSDVGTHLTDLLGMVFDLYGSIVGCCCFLLFLIIAATSGGAMNAGMIIVYLCTFCCFVSTIASMVRYFQKKSKLDTAVAKGRPCKDSKGKTIS